MSWPTEKSAAIRVGWMRLGFRRKCCHFQDIQCMINLCAKKSIILNSFELSTEHQHVTYSDGPTAVMCYALCAAYATRDINEHEWKSQSNLGRAASPPLTAENNYATESPLVTMGCLTFILKTVPSPSTTFTPSHKYTHPSTDSTHHPKRIHIRGD